MIVMVTLNGIAMQETKSFNPNSNQFKVWNRCIIFWDGIDRRYKYHVQVMEERRGIAKYYFADMYRTNVVLLTKGKKIHI